MSKEPGAVHCALVGLYANWLGAQLAALWSARAMFTVHGPSMPRGAAPWMEAVVIVLLNLSVLIIVMCLLILWIVFQSRSRDRRVEPASALHSGARRGAPSRE